MGQQKSSKFVEIFDEDETMTCSPEPITPAAPSPPLSRASSSPQESDVKESFALSLEHESPQCPDLRCEGPGHCRDSLDDDDADQIREDAERSFDQVLTRVDKEMRKSVSKKANDVQKSIDTIDIPDAIMTAMVEEEYAKPKHERCREILFKQGDPAIEIYRNNRADLESNLTSLLERLGDLNENRNKLHDKLKICLAHHEAISKLHQGCLRCLDYLDLIQKDYDKAIIEVNSATVLYAVRLKYPAIGEDVARKWLPDDADRFLANEEDICNIHSRRLVVMKKILCSLKEDAAMIKGWTEKYLQPDDAQLKDGELDKQVPEGTAGAEDHACDSQQGKEYQDARAESAALWHARERRRKAKSKKTKKKGKR